MSSHALSGSHSIPTTQAISTTSCPHCQALLRDGTFVCEGCGNWLRGAEAWPTKLANTVLPPSLVFLRLAMGWIFVWAGFDKLIRGFDAGGFLIHATQGPLGGWYQGLGQNQAALDVINPLVMWGQILIGVALIFGVVTRWAAFWGGAMMFMFYLAQFPPAHNPFMDYYLIYILGLTLLSALGAGRMFGLDALIERLPLVRRIPGAGLVLG